MKRSNSQEILEITTKKQRIENLKPSITCTGKLCVGCNDFYGIEENEGRCSHCYSLSGPDEYRKIALKHIRRNNIQNEMKKNALSEGEIILLKKLLSTWSNKNHGICCTLLYHLLCTVHFFNSEKYLSSQQAEGMMVFLKEIGTCSDLLAERYVYLRVYDYWNINIDNLIDPCRYIQRRNDYPDSVEHLVNEIKKLTLDSIPLQLKEVQKNLL